MNATPTNRDDSIYDPPGTSNLFDELVDSALMLAWNFDEQIDGASPELLEEWRSQLLTTEAYLADIKREFGITT